jgi:CARDB
VRSCSTAGQTAVALVLAACAPSGTSAQAVDSIHAPGPHTPSTGVRDSQSPRDPLAETPNQALLSNRVNLTGLASYELLAPPLPGRDPGALVWYTDHGEQRLAFMRLATRDTPEEIFYVTRKDGDWSSPIGAQFSAFRVRALEDIASLSTGRPLLLMIGDNTDYSQVYGPGQPQHTDPELLALQNQNRRLFSSFAGPTGWSRPQPISGSLGTVFASLQVGPDQRALAIFARDADNDLDTTSDRDLYVAAFDGLSWHPAVRLTEDPGREYAVETAFIAGEFVAVWTRDADGDLTTRGDRTLQFATFALDGAVTRGPTAIATTAYDRPRAVLGERSGHALVVFAGDPLPGTATRPLVESRLDGAWSAPQPTGLQVGNVSRGVMYTHADATLLVYEDDNHLVAAVNRRGVWHSGGLIQSYTASDFRLGEAAYTLDDRANLSIAATGTPRTGDVNSALALYQVQLPLLADLGVGDIAQRPRQLQIGDTVTLSVPVTNRGYLPSGAFDVSVADGGVALAAARDEGLYPGESRTVDLRFPLARAQHNLTVTVTPTEDDLDPTNNTGRVTVSVRPDFAVTSVERAGTSLVAHVRDRKAVATTPVNVDFVLIEGATRTVIGQETFDPNVALPVRLDFPPLATKTTPFVIAVRVNDRTQVVEDDYSNNLSSYVFEPTVDFVLAELVATSDTLRVVVRNVGDLAAEHVAVLVTTDAELAASPAPIPGQTPVALQEISLQDGLGVLELPRSVLDGHDGYFVYAVANPYGAVAERNRNNNSARASRRPALGRPPVYALRRIALAPRSQVVGDLAVREAAAPGGASLELGPEARLEGSARADRIQLAPRAAVTGTVAYNNLVTGPGAHIDGARVTPLALPVAADIPALPAIAAGSSRVTVARGTTKTLAAGAYGDVCVGCGPGHGTTAEARLVLDGGTYQLASLTLAADGHVECAAACELHVAGNVTIADGGSLGPATAAMDALSVRLLVAGDVSLGPQAALSADTVASNGTVTVGVDGHAAGRIVAAEIELGPRAQFTGDGRKRATPAPLPAAIRNQSSHRGQSRQR